MHRALSLSAATLALSALLPSFAQAQTANYSLYTSCGSTPHVSSGLPLSDSGSGTCFNTYFNTNVGQRDVSHDFQAAPGYFGGSFSATYTSFQYHGGGQQASVFLDNFMYTDTFTVVYDNPALAGTVDLTVMVDGQLDTVGRGLGYSSNGTLRLSVSASPAPWGSTGSRGFSGQFVDSVWGSSGTTDLSALPLAVYDGSVVTLSLFADFYVAGTLRQGVNGIYPDVSGADADGYLSWWVDAPAGVRLVSASGHDYTQRVLAVPEPSAIAMLLAGVGVVGVAGLRARRRARAQA